jgi:hypothetical protein
MRILLLADYGRLACCPPTQDAGREFNMSQPIGIDVITDKRGGLVAQGSYAVWCAMVEAAWCGTLASMSLLLQRTVDEPTVALLLQGVLHLSNLMITPCTRMEYIFRSEAVFKMKSRTEQMIYCQWAFCLDILVLGAIGIVPSVI